MKEFSGVRVAIDGAYIFAHGSLTEAYLYHNRKRAITQSIYFGRLDRVSTLIKTNNFEFGWHCYGDRVVKE